MSDGEMAVNLPALQFMARQTNAIILLRQYISERAYPLGVAWEDQPFADEIDTILEEAGAFEEDSDD